jgi:phage-related protein
VSNYNLGVAAGKIIIDGSQAKSGFGIAETAANAFYGAVQSKIDSVRTLGDNLVKVGTTGSAGLGVAIHAAANFEASLSGVKAVSGATDKEMEKLRQTALRIGKDTSFSAKEAADALQELVKAGVSTDDILGGAADATVALAAAGEIDLPRAAEIASSAINNFGIKGKELPHVADLIAGAANASAIDVGDFGFSLSQAGAVANLTGLKFDDLAVAIAEMGQAGIKGSDAGTSIKTFLSNLIPTTTKQIGLFEELGLSTFSVEKAQKTLIENGVKPLSNDSGKLTAQLQELAAKLSDSKVGSASATKEFLKLGGSGGFMQNQFFKADGTMKDFKDVQQVLQESTKNLTKEQKLNTLNTLFGSDAIRASAVFAEQGATGFDNMASAMSKVSAADVAKTRLDNLNGSIENLKGSFETMLIIIGDVFLPIVKKVADGLTGLVNVFNNFPEPVQKTIAIMIGLGSAFSLFTGIAIKLAFILGPMLARFLGFTALRSIFSIFTTGFSALRAGTGIMGSLSLAFGRAGVVFTKFARFGSLLFSVLSRFPALLAVLRTAATVAFGPWGIAIAAVVIAAIALYKNFAPFRELVDNIAKSIKGGLLVALDGIKTAWQAVIDGFKGNTAADGILGFFQKVGFAASLVAAAARDVARSFMENVVPALRAAGGTLMQSLKDAWEKISAVFVAQVLPALSSLWDSLQTLIPPLQRLWEQLQPVLKVLGIIALVLAASVVVELYAFVKVIVVYLLPALITIVAFILDKFITVLAAVISTLIAAGVGIVEFAKGIISGIKGALEAVSLMIEGIVEVFKGMFHLIKGLVTGDWTEAWEGAKQVFQGFKDIVVGIVKAMVSILVGTVVGLANDIKTVFTALMDAIGLDVVPRGIGNIVSWFASLPGKAGHALSSLYHTVVDAVSSAMSTAGNTVSQWINYALDYITSFPGRVGNGLRSLYNTVVSTITGAMSALGTSVRDWINYAVDYIKSFPSRVLAGLGNLGNILWNAGSNLIQGFINGIASRLGQLRDYLGQITGWIPDWKGPPTKDAKLLIDNGKLIMNGLINGLSSRTSALKQMLGDTSDAISDAIGSSTFDLAAKVPPMTVGSEAKKVQDALLNSVVVSPGTTANSTSDGRNDGQPPVEPQVTVNNNYNIYNPVAEKDSVSTTKAATRRANLGVLV